MKTRKGFVSNSSSSSYIVIDRYGTPITSVQPPLEDGIFYGGEIGTTEFGWETCYYRSVWDKINFAYLQTQEVRDDERGAKWLEMLETLLKEKFRCEKIVWLITQEYFGGTETTPYIDGRRLIWGYIDHASSACEGENTEMFDSPVELENFIFRKDSYIRGDNDNHY